MFRAKSVDHDVDRRDRDDIGRRDRDEVDSSNRDDVGSRGRGDVGLRNREDVGLRDRDDVGRRGQRGVLAGRESRRPMRRRAACVGRRVACPSRASRRRRGGVAHRCRDSAGGTRRNPTNSIASAVHDAARWLVGPFDGLFSFHNPKVVIAVNWGIAAVIYLAIAALIVRLLRRPRR